MIKVNLEKNLATSQGKITLRVDFELSDTELISLAGPSGAGKTSILKMIAGLMDPDRGFIQVDQEIWFDSQKGINLPTRQRRIGFVFQEYNLFPNMTVWENLRYALADKRDTDRINELLELLHLTALKNFKPATLSGGEKQRVALIRALLRKPKIFLLDEPLSALDLSLRLKLQDEILGMHKRFRIPTVFVTHDLSEIFKLAHKVFFLQDGKIIRSGIPSEVFAKNSVSGKFKFIGTIVQLDQEDFLYIVTVQIGENLTKVVATQEEAKHFHIGDRVLVAVKAFNPLIMKL